MAISPVVISFAVQGMPQVNREFESLEQRMKRFEQNASRQTEDSSRVRVRATRTEVDERERAYQKLVRETERAERNHERSEIESAKRVAKEVERLEDYKMRVRIRSSELAGRAIARAVEQEERARERLAARATRSIGTSLGMIGQFTGATLGFGGGFALANAARSSIDNQRLAIELANSSYIPGVRERPDVGGILGTASMVQRGTNVGKGDLLKGWREYVKLSSDFEGGQSNLFDFAKLSKASGTDFTELMRTAGALRVQNANMSPGDMMNILRGIVGQGKIGAVEFEDLAKVAGRVTASSGMYAGDQATNQRRLLGLAQIARQTVGDSAEAATVVERFSSDVSAHRGKLGAHGISVTNKAGQLLDPAQILSSAFEKTGGRVDQLQHLGFNRESIKLAEALLPTFNQAGGGKAGAQAVFGQVSKFENAGYSAADVDRDFAETVKGSGEKFEHALQQVQDALERELTPELGKLADKLPELVPEIESVIRAGGALAEWFLDNPFAGIGVVLAAAVAKDVASAAIGNAISRAIAGAAGGGVNVATMTVAAAAVSMLATKAAVDADVKDQQDAQRADIMASVKNSQTRGVPLDELKRRRAVMQKIVDENRAAVGHTGVLEGAVQGIAQVEQWGANTFGGGKKKTFADDMIDDKVKEQARTLDLSVQSLRSLNAEIERLGGNVSRVKPPAAPISEREHTPG